MRPFGCRLLYEPPKAKLPTFTTRVRNGINLLHQSGGICQVLTESGVIRTKRIRAVEEEFPGVPSSMDEPYATDSAISEADSNEGSTEESSPEADNDGSDSSEDGDGSEDGGETLHEGAPAIDTLSYVPAKPSTLRETHDDVESGSEQSPSQLPMPSQVQEEEVLYHPYNLRSSRNVDYSAMALPTTISTIDEPKVRMALQSDERQHWIDSIKQEFDTIATNETWNEVSQIPTDARPLPSGVILRLKRDANGQPARSKARLVARGNFQSDAVDYTELYAPVACTEPVRIMLSVASYRNWSVEQVDVKGAFIHAPLPKPNQISIRLPVIQGVSGANGKVVRLAKSLYGVRQAPMLCYGHLAKSLSGIGYKRSAYSDCLFSS